MNGNASPIIEVRGLCHSYSTSGAESTPVLFDVDLSIRKGEMIALQGASGSGKSTLFHILGGLLRVQKGEVRIAGENVSRLNDLELAHLRNRVVGFIFQQFYLLPKATILENILLPSLYPVEEGPPDPATVDRAREIAVRLGLGDRLLHLPNQLSGGQQQRVAIARALLRNPEILLADEPTGALDSKTAQQILDLLKELNSEGRTVLIITHDPEVARQCDRIVQIRDGRIRDSDSMPSGERGTTVVKPPSRSRLSLTSILQMAVQLAPMAIENLRRNKTRSGLTMFGIVIGIASLFSMITVGNFVKAKVMENFAVLGTHTIRFTGYKNWNRRATDTVPAEFNAFEVDRDLEPLLEIIPEIVRYSPVVASWPESANFGGRSFQKDLRLIGVSHQAFLITKPELLLGSTFSEYHVSQRSPVCLIGHGVYQELFRNTDPIGQLIHIVIREQTAGCRVVGVLTPQPSNNLAGSPDTQIVLPYTYIQGALDTWQGRIRQFLAEVRPGADIQETGKKIQALFQRKYGVSGEFAAGYDSQMLAFMGKFLTLFTALLSTIGVVSLIVGGVGITNMMLVSVSERYREIGIRKAFGATDSSVRIQFLTESVLVCAIAGAAGVGLGVAFYQAVLFGVSLMVEAVKYQWILDWTALVVSTFSILAVGIVSGIVPAMKAQKLQVIEALRSE